MSQTREKHRTHKYRTITDFYYQYKEDGFESDSKLFFGDRTLRGERK